MESTSAFDAAEKRARESRNEAIRRALRARYPVLRDGAAIPASGGALADGFARNLLDLAVRSVRTDGIAATDIAGSAGRPACVQARWTAPDLRRILTPLTAGTNTPTDPIPAVSLTEVGPYAMYAHWDLPDAVLAGTRARLGEEARDAVLTLRFYDVTGIVFDGSNANHTFDIDLDAAARSRYVDVWSPDRGYLADLGLRTPDGRFRAIARSGTVHVPRDAILDESRERFLRREPNRIPLARPSVPQLFSEAAPPEVVRQGEPDWPLRDLEAERCVRAVYRAFLREGPRAFVRFPRVHRRPASILTEEHARRRDRRHSQNPPTPSASAPSVARSAAPDVFCTRLDTASRPADRIGLRYPPIPASRRPEPSPLGESGTPAQRVFDLATRLGTRNPIATQRPALPAPTRLRSLPAPSTDRPKAVRIPKGKGIVQSLAEAGIELEAELVLRGRVPAGKKLRIGGQIIETAPDGSFCVSCKIRNGELHVPVEAVEAERVVAREEFSVAAPCSPQTVGG